MADVNELIDESLDDLIDLLDDDPAETTENTIEEQTFEAESDEVLEDADNPDVAIRWIPKDDRAADWCLRKIRECEDEYERFKEFYAVQLESVRKKMDQKKAFFQGALQSYFRDVPKHETKTQASYQLPSGKLVFTKPKRDFEHDDEALLAWAKKSGADEFIKLEEKIKWGDLKKQLVVMDDGKTVCRKDTGEVVDGVNGILTTASFDAKPEKAK